MTSDGAFPGLDTPLLGSLATWPPAPVIEAAMVWRFGWSLRSLPPATFGVVGAMVTATDLAGRRIPNLIVLPACPMAAALLAGRLGRRPDLWWPFARAAIAAVLLAGVLPRPWSRLPGRDGPRRRQMGRDDRPLSRLARLVPPGREPPWSASAPPPSPVLAAPSLGDVSRSSRWRRS